MYIIPSPPAGNTLMEIQWKCGNGVQKNGECIRCFTLTLIKLRIILLSVIMPSVIMLNVNIPRVVASKSYRWKVHSFIFCHNLFNSRINFFVQFSTKIVTKFSGFFCWKKFLLESSIEIELLKLFLKIKVFRNLKEITAER